MEIFIESGHTDVPSYRQSALCSCPPFGGDLEWHLNQWALAEPWAHQRWTIAPERLWIANPFQKAFTVLVPNLPPISKSAISHIFYLWALKGLSNLDSGKAFLS
jgi:hypothetical protein